VWGFECADLSGLGKADVEHVKAFASRQEDRARPAYGRSVEYRKRRCVLWATTNDDEYLQSQSGNRRFWPLKVLRPINLEKLAADRDQLWAEAAVIEAQTQGNINIPEYLWADAAEAQEDRRVADPWEARLVNLPEGILVDAEKPTERWVQIVHRCEGGELRVAAGTLMTYALCVPVERQTSQVGRRLAVVMKKLGWKRHDSRKVWIEGGSVAGFYDDRDTALAQAEADEAYVGYAARRALLKEKAKG